MICSKIQIDSLSKTVGLVHRLRVGVRSITTLPPRLRRARAACDPPPPLLRCLPLQSRAAAPGARDASERRLTAARPNRVPVVRILMRAPSTVPRATFGSQPYQGRPQDVGIWITWIRNGGNPGNCGRRDHQGRRDRRGAGAGDPLRRAPAGHDAPPGAARRAVRREPHADPRGAPQARRARPRRLPAQPGRARPRASRDELRQTIVARAALEGAAAELAARPGSARTSSPGWSGPRSATSS